ncbi:hypothetical protein Tco_1336893 [Tanacetum coccineum]
MFLNLWRHKAVRLRYSNPMIQPEPEGSTQGYPLVSVEVLRFYTSAGNPVKEILLKLNLPDHRKLKDGGEVKEFQRSFCHSDTERLSRSDEVLKLKNFKKDATLKLFKSTNQESILQQSTPIPTPTTIEATISTTTALDSSTLTAIHQRLSNMENEVKTLRNIDLSSAIRVAIKFKVPTVVKEYLGTSLDYTLHKIFVRSRWNKQANSKRLNTPSLHLIWLNYKNLIRKEPPFNTMTKTKSFNNNTKYKALYHALMKSILEDEDAMYKGVTDRLKKRNPDDADRDEGPPVGPDQGLKRKKTSKDVEPSKKAKST